MHTIIIGTSKSKNSAGYYFDSKKKFWGLLYNSGLTPKLLEPTDYKSLINDFGIGFGELAFDHVFLGEDIENESIRNDKTLNEQIGKLNIGIPKLINFINDTKPKRIVFNGKSATSSFYKFLKTGKVEKVSAAYSNELGLNYGMIENWNGIEIWMMPNTSNAAGNSWNNDKGEERWMNFWKMIKNEVPKKKKSFVWLWIILAALLITAIIYKTI